MKNSRIFRQLVIAAGLLTLSGAPAILNAQEATQSNTQDQATSMQHAQKHEDELSKLNLSDDQKAQVKKIHEDMRSQMSAIQSDTTLSADQKQEKMQQLRKTSHQQINQLLTPEQRKQMKADEDARKAARQQNGQAAPPQQ